MNEVVEKVNDYVGDNGLEKGVKVLAVIGVFASGRLIVKGVRELYNMVKKDGAN
jgi:hypothetical protein